MAIDEELQQTNWQKIQYAYKLILKDQCDLKQHKLGVKNVYKFVLYYRGGYHRVMLRRTEDE